MLNHGAQQAAIARSMVPPGADLDKLRLEIITKQKENNFILRLQNKTQAA